MIKSLAINLITCNGGDLVMDALKAVEPYSKEIRIIDDNSTDNDEMFNKIKKTFPQVFIEKIRGTEWHVYKRRILLNKLKSETKSDWILRIDDDEIYPPELMEEIMNLEDNSKIAYTIPMLHYDRHSDSFIDPAAHKPRSLMIARLFKNIPEVYWGRTEEVICFKRTPISSRGFQYKICGILKNPFVHLGELKVEKWPRLTNYHFHESGHCSLPLGKYEHYVRKYVPGKN